MQSFIRKHDTSFEDLIVFGFFIYLQNWTILPNIKKNITDPEALSQTAVCPRSVPFVPKLHKLQ